MDLIDFLTEQSYVTSDVSQLLRRFQKVWNCSPYESVLEVDLYSESDLANLVATATQLGRVYKLSEMSFGTNALVCLPFQKAKELGCMPIEVAADNETLSLAVYDPFDTKMLDMVKRETDYQLKLMISERNEIQRAVKLHYSVAEQIGAYDR